MYRIRLTAGEEAVYRTVEELAQAVASGVVSPQAEVFHRAGNRWLPIHTHPDYRALVTGKRPLVRLSAPHPSPPEAAESEDLDATPRSSPAVQVPAQKPAQSPPSNQGAVPSLEAEVELLLEASKPTEIEPESVAEVGRPRRKRVATAVFLGVGVLTLVAIGVGAYSWLSGHPRAARALPEQDEGMAPAPVPSVSPAEAANLTPPAEAAIGLVRLDTVAVEYPSPSKPLPMAGASTTPRGPAAPRVVSRLGTTVTRLPSYFEAYADARAEMDESLNYVNFRRVFAPHRFGSQDSLRAARRMVVAAGNILRVYRSREVMLEQTYRPGEPEGRSSLREPFEVAEASRGLLADVDSLFGILVEQESAVRYRDQALFFQNRRAAQAYADLRRRIIQTLAGLGDAPEAADRVTLPRLLRALTPDRPPPAR
jgi:hypothetical protein